MKLARAAAAVCALLCLAAPARGAPPAGPYSYLIGGDSEIWYPSGDAEFCEPDAPGSSCLDTSVSTGGTGAVLGTGVWHAHITGQADGDVGFTIAGQLAGSTRVPKPKIVVEFAGDITLHVEGVDVPLAVTGTGKFTCKNPLPHGPTFQCPGHAKLCGVALGRKKCFGTGSVRIDLAAAGGPWRLDTDLLTDPNTGAISGDGAATLQNTSSQAYVAKGKYSAKSDLSKLTLTPLDPTSKNKVTFSDTFGAYVPGGPSKKIKFKVAGVSGVFLIPIPPP
ncbi:MAG TPA: hypothetical protein VMR86_10000 [Myxococcota bacterium]|nr:hypothetical protein [Myxococcota bacterium]